MPRWVEPDSPEGDGGDPGDAGTAFTDEVDKDDLSQKPVLEWTNEDWARWVDSPDLALPDPPAPEPEGEAEADVEDESEGPLAAAGLDQAVEPEPDRATPEWVRVLEEVAPVGAADVTGAASGEVAVEPAPAEEVEPVLEPAAAAIEPVEVEPTPDEVDPEVVEGDGAVEEEMAPTGEWFFGTEEHPDEPDAPPVIITGTFPQVSPAARADSGAPWTEEEWAEVAEHPWWQSAPEPDPASARLVALPDPPVESVEAVEAEVQPEPVPEPSPPLPPPAPVLEAVPPMPLSPPAAEPRPAPRITRPAPARRQVSKPGPAVYIDETPHRIRAAFSLLGVAVLVGTVMAGLITIVVVAISLALRQAVG